MDDNPKTRQEKKGNKKDSNPSVYSSRRVRQMEAMIEKKGINPSSSTSKTPAKTEASSSNKSKPRKK